MGECIVVIQRSHEILGKCRLLGGVAVRKHCYAKF